MSLITTNKPQPSTLEKHLMTLRRLADRKARAEYLIAVNVHDGAEMASALHQAYADGWTTERARVAQIAAQQPAGGKPWA